MRKGARMRVVVVVIGPCVDLLLVIKGESGRNRVRWW